MFLDLERLVARDAARAHEHFEEDVAQREGVGFGGEGGEGGVGYVEGGGGDGKGVGGVEGGEEGEVGCWVEVGGGD